MKISYTRLATKGVQGLTPYQPGKPIEELERELGISNSLKLASNENPLGPSDVVQKVLAENVNTLHLYPDGSGHRLRQRLAEEYQLSMDQITLGNGSNDILELIARAFLTTEDSAIYSEFAFAVYPIVIQAIGAKAVIAKAYSAEHENMPYGHDLDAILAAVDNTTRLVFIANPNNPTGTWIEPEQLQQFLKLIDKNIIVVLDEAYFEYMPENLQPDSIQWLADFPNLIITRTFSKIHALAGLRVGYALSSPELADILNRVRQPFNVNTLAQLAACTALDDLKHVQQSKILNDAGMQQVINGIKALGLSAIPSIGNFICVDIKQLAAPIYQALLHEGVIVRPVANYGLPQHLRITIGTAEQNQRVLTALAKVLS